MFLNDIDPQFLKSVNFLYCSDSTGDDVSPLQFYLEEAIKAKNGLSKDLTAVVQASVKQQRLAEYKTFIKPMEDSKESNSDNELELDLLLKEDLMCIVCNKMDVGARNRLLECSDCHMLYHQECHKPIVINQDSFDSWVCQTCKDLKKSKVIPVQPTVPVTVPTTTVKTSSSFSSSKSSSHRHSNSSSSYKSSSKSDKYSKSGSSSSKGASSSSSSSKATSSSTRTSVTPNINIISADKRIQIMKKKAAKLQEKRKHSSR